jgi:hypothetical protein
MHSAGVDSSDEFPAQKVCRRMPFREVDEKRSVGMRKAGDSGWKLLKK